MRHVIRIVTHMLVSGTCMLLFTKTFRSSWEVVIYSVIIMLLVAFLYGLRSKTKSFWMFLGSHVVLIVGGNFLIPMFGAYKWYIAIWCFWIVYSVILRLVPAAENLDEPGVFYVVVLAIAYFVVCFLEGSIVTQRLSLISTALVFLLYLLYRNMNSMDEFIFVGSFSNKIDEQGIRRLNHRLSILYTGILGVLLAIFSLFRVEGLWNRVLEGIRSLFRFLLSLMPMPEEVQLEEEAEMENDMFHLLHEMVQEKEPSAWMILLGEILRGIIAFVIVIAIVAGIIYVAIYVYRHFYNKKKREEGDKVIESLSLGSDITKERKPRFFERFERSPARRIRKIYKRSLKRVGAKYMSGLAYMSPDEQVQFLHKQGMSEEAIDEMKSLYEKARYSADVVTESEAERMRAIL